MAQYHNTVTGERESAIAAYRTLLEQYPDDHIALNNTGVLYYELRDYERALDFYQRALAQAPSSPIQLGNVASTQIELKRFEEAAATIDLFEQQHPGNPRVATARFYHAYAQGDYDSARVLLLDLRQRQRGNPFWQEQASRTLAQLSTLQGRLREAAQHWEDVVRAVEQRGLASQHLGVVVERAVNEGRMFGHGERAARMLDEALGRFPLDSLPLLDRPYAGLVRGYAYAGQIDRAREILEAFEASGQAALGRDFERQQHAMRGLVAMGERDFTAAIAEYRQADDGSVCLPCGLVTLGAAYDAAGEADSALAILQRYTEIGQRWSFLDDTELPLTHRRLGELYEERGDRERALAHYDRFVELWQDADPELEPQVDEVQARMARLAGEG